MESLERRLGYAFHDRSLLSEALNHQSLKHISEPTKHLSIT